MENSTALKRWLALVRVATGAVFVYMSTGHLLGGVATADGFQKMVGGFAKSDPIQAYTSVMVPIVSGAPGLFGPLFVFGMLAAGLGLDRFLWTGAWHPYLLDSMLFARRAAGGWQRAVAGQRG
jgi:hypothetical protein